MANECMNYITVNGNKELIQIFADSYLKKEGENYHLDFNIIAPIPDDCENDYVFRIENWGNKWDGTNGNVEFWGEDEIFIDVATAWGPCDKITYKLISLCPGLHFYHEYYESGEGFIGWIEHYENEPPDEFEDIYYNVSENPHEYWYWMFEKEFENFDWLYECVEDMKHDEEITEEVCNTVQKMINENNEMSLIIEYCLEEGVLS